MDKLDSFLPRDSGTREEEILSKRAPLKTLLWLSLGPLCSQLSSSMYGVASSIWLPYFDPSNSARIKATLSLVLTLDFTPVALGFFVSVSCSIKLSSLFAEPSYRKAGQVLNDLLRFCIVLGLLCPAVLIPIAKPLMRWLYHPSDGTDIETVVSEGFKYLIVISVGTFPTTLYFVLCGCLEAEGRTGWYSIAQIASMVLGCLVFDPLSIKVLNLGICGPPVSIIAAQLIPAIVLLIGFYRGWFSVKLSVRDLLLRPIRESGHALALGLSSLLSSLSSSAPVIVFQYCLGKCEKPEPFDTTGFLALYNDYTRLYAVAIALYLALCTAFLSAGSYAYSAVNVKRVNRLLFHTFWMLGVLGISFALIMDLLTTQIAELFQVESEALIEKWTETAPKYWSSTTLLAWMYLGTCLLQVANRPIYGLVCAFVGQTVVFPIVSWFWYYFTENGVEMFWAGLTNDTVAFTLTMLFDIPVFIELVKRRSESWESIAETKHERLP